MATSNSTIIEEAITAVAQFVALPESEKTLEDARRVVVMMDDANKKFLAQIYQSILDLQSSISKDEGTKEALKNQLAELNGDSVHLANRGDAGLQSQDSINTQNITKARRSRIRVRSSQKNLGQRSKRKGQSSSKGTASLGKEDKE